MGVLILDDDLFERVDKALQEAVAEGRDEIIFPMNNSLKIARTYWDNQNLRGAFNMLQSALRWVS